MIEEIVGIGGAMSERTDREVVSPRVGVAVVVVRDGKVLIGEGHNPEDRKLTYAVPGGHWESGETLVACAKRETLEEAGILIKNVELISVYEFYNEERGRSYVTIGMRAEWDSGEPSLSPTEARRGWDWYDPQAIPAQVLDNLFKPDKVLLERHMSGVIYQEPTI